MATQAHDGRGGDSKSARKFDSPGSHPEFAEEPADTEENSSFIIAQDGDHGGVGAREDSVPFGARGRGELRSPGLNSGVESIDSL
jgi:hypothetical protein